MNQHFLYSGLSLLGLVALVLTKPWKDTGAWYAVSTILGGVLFSAIFINFVLGLL